MAPGSKRPHAHACVLSRDEGETRLRALLTEAVPLRTRLLSSAETLVTFGLLDPREIASVRSGPTTDIPGAPPLEPPPAEAGEGDADEV